MVRRGSKMVSLVTEGSEMKPIVNKHVVLAFMIYLLWVIGFAFYSYQHEKQALYGSMDQQLELAALTAPLLLPKGLHHQAMSAGELTIEQDYENTLKLSKYTDDSDIVYIYTMVLRDQQVYFTTSSATIEERELGEDIPSWFDLYNDVDPRVIDVFNKGEKAFIEYTDRWGTFRSIFIPQYADDGTYYVTAADLTIDHIQSLLAQNIYRTINSKKRTILYSVKQGDSLYRIADIFNIQIEDIIQLNSIIDNEIKPGQVLKIIIRAF